MFWCPCLKTASILGDRSPSRELTALFRHPVGDLDEDPCVAGDHHDQWQQEEAAEGEHVVGSFLPVSDEAAPRGALSKVGWICDGHIVENEHLWI